jgi:hypothetical protein
MAEINKNMQIPSIEQIQKPGRDIYYKEHEFLPDYAVIIAELNELLKPDDDVSPSIIALKRKEIKEILDSHDRETLDSLMVMNDKMQLLLNELINIDSAYERLYQKIYNDIEIININIINHIQAYNVPKNYYTEMRNKIFDIYRKKSAYITGEANGDTNDLWSIKAPGVIQLRDVDVSDRMITFPINIGPAISQDTYVKLFSLKPLLNIKSDPAFLAELIISGDLYTFKGYLKSEDIDKTGKRGAIFDAEYALSHELPFSFKIVYDKDSNDLACLFKYDNTPNKFTSIIQLEFSIHLLVGRNLYIEEPNTIFEEQIAV